MSDPDVTQFVSKMNSLDGSNIKQVLEQTYSANIKFIDPVKTIHGLEELTSYFEHLYKSVDKCQFTLNADVSNSEGYSLQWIMKLRHQKISKHKEILLDGASFLKYQGNKVCYQRDYYDMGAMVYEHIPFIGILIKKIRHAI